MGRQISPLEAVSPAFTVSMDWCPREHKWKHHTDKSGASTDLALMCRNCVYKVHKSVVCGQSILIKEAVLRERFKECQASCYVMDDGYFTSLRQFVEYLYEGTYQAGRQVDGSPATPGSELLEHIRLSAMGDYFMVDGLGALAHARAHDVIKRHGRSLDEKNPAVAGLLDVLREAWCTPDKADLLGMLRDIDFLTCTKIDELDAFASLCEAPGFSSAVLKLWYDFITRPPTELLACLEI